MAGNRAPLLRHRTGRIKVLHFTDLPVPNPWLNGVAAHYDRTRFEHLVVTLGPPCDLHRELQRREVPSFALSAAGRADFPRAVIRLARLLRTEHVDILQTHLFWPSILGLVGGTLARTPIKLVTRHHSDFTTTFNHPVHRRLDQLQARWADHVLAASAAVKRDMMRLESVPEHRITVTRYGYDFTALRPQLTPEARSMLRRELGAEGRTLAVTVARLSPSKGHRFLFEALSSLVGEHPGLLLVLAGTGPLEAELRDLVAGLGIADHVKFLGWRDDAHRIIEAADLVVHPSLHEAFCSVIVESMALERPLIAWNVAAAPEQIDDNKTGLLVPPRDSQAIRDAIAWVLDHQDEARTMGALARQSVVQRFNFPRMMAWYEQVYDEMVSSASLQITM